MLQGSEFKSLCDALIDAYGSRSALEQLVRFSLSHSLNAIVGEGGIEKVIFDLLEWTERRGKTAMLLEGAIQLNPDNTQLAAAVQAYYAGQNAAASSGRNGSGLRGYLSRNTPQRNPYFTGREEELDRLHTLLQTRNAALTPVSVPLALQGTGGMGKTQTAAEYAHRFRHEYDGVFWVVGETTSQLASQLAALAPELVPSVPTQADQEATLQLVRQWFGARKNWLLIVDNAGDLPELKPILPPLASGRLLLTTRDTDTGDLAESVEVERLDETDGARLLLRRAGKLPPDGAIESIDTTWQAGAKAICQELGGLPLALDQAGAYLQTRKIMPADYLTLYRQHRQSLHTDYKNRDHASVAVTFEVALKQMAKIRKYGKAAAQLATYCAFLAPDALPDEIFTSGAKVLDEPLATLAADTLQWTEVCAAATRYSLLRRDADTSTLTMHRLAQEVVRNRLTDDEQKRKAEQVVLAVHRAFPEVSFPTWPKCERLLAHALLCREYITVHDFRTPAASWLLNGTGWYLRERARYGEAELLYQEALAIRRATQGEEHEEVATVLTQLGLLYRQMGRYVEAIGLLEQALAIGRKTIGEAHPDYAIRLDNLAGAYYMQDRYAEAEPLLRQALDITRRELGPNHPSVAIRLNNLASLYDATQRYGEAEPLYREALEIDRQTRGESDPEYAKHLRNLGSLYLNWDRPEEAEPFLQQALSIAEAAQGKAHPAVAYCHSWLGELRYHQGDWTQAANHFRQALATFERILGPNHRDTMKYRAWLAFVEALIPNPSPLLEADTD